MCAFFFLAIQGFFHFYAYLFIYTFFNNNTLIINIYLQIKPIMFHYIFTVASRYRQAGYKPQKTTSCFNIHYHYSLSFPF